MSEIKKITFAELEEDKSWMKAVIVFTKDSFTEDYSEVERSYEVASSNKYFNPRMNGNSLIGSCLDGKDNGVRLDIYMNDGWEVEHCYIVE